MLIMSGDVHCGRGLYTGTKEEEMFNRFSKTLLVPDPQQQRGQMVIKALPIFLIPTCLPILVGLLVRFFFVDAQHLAPPPTGLPILVGLSTIIIFCIALLLVQLGRPTLSAFVLVGLWTLTTTILALDNSVSTFLPAMLIIPICAAGLLLDATACITMAVLATVLVGSSAWLESRGMIQFAHSSPVATPSYFSAVYWAMVIWSIALLTSLLASGMQRALAQSRAQAQVLRDLSDQLEERVALQTAELARRATRAEGLHQVGHELVRTHDRDEVLGIVSEHAARLLRFDTALVLLCQGEDNDFKLVAAYQPPAWITEDMWKQQNTDELQTIVQQRQPRITHLAGSAGSASALIVPMVYGDDVAGMLALFSEAGNVERDADDRALAEELADYAAMAVANVQLLERSRERATLEERTRLARDIHDTLAQGLTGIVVQLSAAQHALRGAPDEVEQFLDLAQRMARESLAEARRSVWNLRAPSLERGDLADALRTLVSRPLRQETAIRFELTGTPWQLAADAESALLRICQEALVNIAKHAQAREALVQLTYLPEAVHLCIRDNGVGVDEQAVEQRVMTSGPHGGFGILGMRERISLLGGRLDLINDGGTTVSAWVPRHSDRFTEQNNVVGPRRKQVYVEHAP